MKFNFNLVFLSAITSFNREVASSWTQIGADIEGASGGDNSGWALDLSSDGKVLAVGAPGNNGRNDNGSNFVRVYSLNKDDKWTQIGLDINGESAYDESGYAVALSADGSVVAVGAPLSDENGSDASGHVRVYRSDGGVWTKIGADIGGESDDEFGFAVALSSDGKVLAVGAPGNDGNGDDSGHVRVFSRLDDPEVWTKIGDIDGESVGDQSGWAVDLSSDGKRLAVGAPYNDENGSDSGHVRVYGYNDVGVWTQIGEDIDGEFAGDQSGYAVSLSSDGSVIAVGAPGNDVKGSNTGHVRVYQLIGNNWTKIGADIDGESGGDSFGWAVDLSSDGNVLAVGAPDNHSQDKGHVRVFSRLDDPEVWTQIGADINGQSAWDNSGSAVALSSDGNRVASGAHENNNGNGYDAGHVRVYDFQDPSMPSSVPTEEPSLHYEKFITFAGKDFVEQFGTEVLTDNDYEGLVGWYDEGDYLTYGPVDFGESGETKGIIFEYNKENRHEGIMEVRLDGPEGQVIAEFSPGSTSGWKWQYVSKAYIGIDDVDGVHKFSLVGKLGSSILNVASIELSDFADRTKKYAQIDPTQYSYSKGAVIGSNDISDFDNGEYVTYSSINFGSSGTSTRILITYAKNNTGGKVEIRIGGPDGTLIGTFSPSNTGSWDVVTKTDDVPINDVEGIHDVTFVGYDRNDIMNIRGFQLWSYPTSVPSSMPSSGPSSMPSFVPTKEPSLVPSFVPTKEPSLVPSSNPTEEPSLVPSSVPTEEPSLVHSSVPTEKPSHVPSFVPTEEPSLVPSFVPTKEPSLVPSSVPTKEPSLVPSFVPTKEPSLVPSSVPTEKPSSSFVPTEKPSHVPSFVPTEEPSLVPSSVPTEEAQKDAVQANQDYKISMIDNSTTVNFDEENSSEEIRLFLNISKAQVDELDPISVHKKDDCNGDSIFTDVLNATKQDPVSTDMDPGYEKVEVTVDVKIDNIVDNVDVFEYKPDSNNEIAYLSFCVAANLGSITVYNNETGISEKSSISYLHMLFNITISLSQGFTATSVDIEEVSPNNVDESVDVDYNVLSCECVPSSKACLGVEENVTYSQNSELNICVYTIEDDIQIRDIKDLDLKQSTTGITLRAIEDYQSNSVTSVSDGNEKIMLVSTRIVSAFFTGLINNEGKLEIEGTATIEFVGSRKLMILQGESDRVTQEEGDGEGTFELDVNLSTGEELIGESAGVQNYFTFLTSSMLLAFGMAICESWN